jgi:hypothetical protein
LQLFGQQTGLNAGHDLDDEHAGEHRAEHGQQRLGILHDSQGFSLQQQIAHDTAADHEEAVDDAGQKISQVLSIVGDRNDLVPMRLVCNEGVDAVVGIDEPGNDAEAKLLLRESVEHLLDRVERVSAARTSRQDQNIRLGSIRF